jgi:hypothetical protein
MSNLKENFKTFTISNQLVFYSPEAVSDFSFKVEWKSEVE